MHFVLPFFHPVMGGVETRVREMGARLAARGHAVSVHVMARTPAGERLAPEDRLGALRIVRYEPVFHRGGYALFYRPRIPDGDLADVQAYPFLPGDWLRMTRRRSVALVHTPLGAPFVPPMLGARLLVKAYDALLGLPTLRRARRVVTSTRNEADWLTAHGVAPQRVVEVPNGVPDDAFGSADPGLARERWGLGRYVLFLGRLYREKGPGDVVEALARLGKEHGDVAAVFAGPDQGEGARLIRRAKELGLGTRVVLAGQVPEPEKRRLLAGCELLTLPSAWEAQGIVLVEAWAQGKPVVATRVGGIPHMVEEGRTGLLVPWADPPALGAAFEALLGHPAKARAMGLAGREVARERYRWDDLAVRLEGVHADALAG